MHCTLNFNDFSCFQCVNATNPLNCVQNATGNNFNDKFLTKYCDIANATCFQCKDTSDCAPCVLRASRALIPLSIDAPFAPRPPFVPNQCARGLCAQCIADSNCRSHDA